MRNIAKTGKDVPFASSGAGSGVVLHHRAAAAASLWMRLRLRHTARRMAPPRSGQHIFKGFYKRFILTLFFSIVDYHFLTAHL